MTLREIENLIDEARTRLTHCKAIHREARETVADIELELEYLETELAYLETEKEDLEGGENGED